MATPVLELLADLAAALGRGIGQDTATGTHRRVRRRDVEALRTRTERMTRDQLRSLWLNHAVAGQLVTRPGPVLEVARANLEHLRHTHARGQASRWLDAWSELLDGPVEDVLEALTSRTPRSRELRQNSRFAGVLDSDVRSQVLTSYASVKHATTAR